MNETCSADCTNDGCGFEVSIERRLNPIGPRLPDITTVLGDLCPKCRVKTEWHVETWGFHYGSPEFPSEDPIEDEAG